MVIINGLNILRASTAMHASKKKPHQPLQSNPSWACRLYINTDQSILKKENTQSRK